MRRTTDDAEKEACWKEEQVWHEANPALGSVISLESFREDFTRAVQSPRLENAFKRYRLNIWTSQVERWLSMDHWLACGERLDPAELLGQPCWAGLDLASVSDFCALVLWFPDAGNAILPFFWVPEDTVRAMEVKGDPLYDLWVRQGHLRATPGNVTDYEYIYQTIIDLSQQYDVQEIAYDRWNASHIVTQLQGAGLNLTGFGQGFASMAAPCREFERLLTGKELRHGNHPVMTWCVGNVAVQQDAAGNYKPNKALSKRKIDGVVAALMALGCVLVRPEPGSVYDRRGILSI